MAGARDITNYGRRTGNAVCFPLLFAVFPRFPSPSFAFLCLLPLSFAFLCLPSLSYAYNPGTTAAPILKLDIGARALGMGGAYAALADDVYGLRYNPAGLGQFHSPEASAMYMSGLAESRLQFAGFGMPLNLPGFSGMGAPGIGASVIFSQSGDMEYNRTSPDGSFLSSDKIKSGSDLVAALAYGEKVAQNDTQLFGRAATLSHYAGVSLKYISSTLAQSYSASAFAADLGYMAVEPESGLSFGAAISNIGGKMTFIDEGDPLPMIYRAGAAFRKSTFLDQSIAIAAQADHYATEKENRLRAGLEYRFEKIFAVRLGYQGLRDIGGITVGLGIQQANLSLDFAMAFASELTNTQQLSVTYRFQPRKTSGRTRGTRDRYREKSEPVQPARAKKSPKNRKAEGVPGWVY